MFKVSFERTNRNTIDLPCCSTMCWKFHGEQARHLIHNNFDPRRSWIVYHHHPLWYRPSSATDESYIVVDIDGAHVGSVVTFELISIPFLRRIFPFYWSSYFLHHQQYLHEEIHMETPTSNICQWIWNIFVLNVSWHHRVADIELIGGWKLLWIHQVFTLFGSLLHVVISRFTSFAYIGHLGCLYHYFLITYLIGVLTSWCLLWFWCSVLVARWLSFVLIETFADEPFWMPLHTVIKDVLSLEAGGLFTHWQVTYCYQPHALTSSSIPCSAHSALSTWELHVFMVSWFEMSSQCVQLLVLRLGPGCTSNSMLNYSGYGWYIASTRKYSCSFLHNTNSKYWLIIIGYGGSV